MISSGLLKFPSVLFTLFCVDQTVQMYVDVIKSDVVSDCGNLEEL